MSLNLGTKIGRYEIRSLLGAGGMGEVYRAFDSQLEREVALKFLKHADDPEKLRRFRQEAKAIATLNHPNILTIYEVGKFEDYHFIVSELVNGENLRDCISEKKLSLGEILDISIQIGNALAAAHAVGIVHRDIKPENIMVLPDGYVKVLDFGLAKFIGLEKNLTSNYDASTASLIQTKAGMIIGTVNYMSPEQLRGKPVDECTDIWSLGVVLFEMLTHRRPFAGESVSDVIASVLEHPSPQLSRFDAGIPYEVETVVGRALEKKKELRFQTAKEFVSALKNAKSVSQNGSFTALNKSSFSNSFHSQKTYFTNKDDITAAATENLSGLFIGGTRVRWRLLGLLGCLFATTLAIGGWRYIYRPLVQQPPAKQAKFQRLTTTGNVTNGAISPDGRWFAFVQDNDGQNSLWLKQVEGGSAKELIPASNESYGSLTFTPDGNWIYYTVFGGGETGKLNRIALLGDSRMEIARDVDSTVSFAPDGKNFAFIRGNPKEGIDRIVISDKDGSTERVLSEKTRPEFYTIGAREGLAWSPDGKFIAAPFGRINADNEFMSVVEINVETGEEKPLTEAKWNRVGRVAWTKNSEELLITAAEQGSDIFQIIKISRSTGTVSNVSTELKDYFNLSLTADSTLMLGVAYDKTSNIYIASREEPNQIKRIAGGNYDGVGGVLWTPDSKRIIYVSAESGNRDIWMMDADGTNKKRLTFEKDLDDLPSVSKDGKYIAYVSSRAGVQHIWRMNLNGGEQKQLTNRGGENLPSIAPDGSFVIYSSRTQGLPALWKISTDGGNPAQLTKDPTNWSAISPDGKYAACLTREGTPPQTKLAIISAETGEFLNRFKTMGTVIAPMLPTTIRWLPDGQAVAYVATTDGVSNIWLQPVNGGEPKKITDFTTDRIFSFDWSNDGKTIIYARGALHNDLVLIRNF